MSNKKKYSFSTKMISVLVCVIIFGVYLFRYDILTGIGQFLIKTDTPEKVDVAFVLAGNANDRGRGAAKLYKEGYIKKIITTGETTERILRAYNIYCDEAHLTAKVLIDNKVKLQDILPISYSTSTLEEMRLILNYCQTHQLKKIMIISSLYHTRRIHTFFRKQFTQKGIKVVLVGTDDNSFDEIHWWQSEYGLIALNNEYIKLGYYLIRN